MEGLVWVTDHTDHDLIPGLAPFMPVQKSLHQEALLWLTLLTLTVTVVLGCSSDVDCSSDKCCDVNEQGRFGCQQNDYRGLGVCCQGSDCRLRQCSVSDQCGRWRICQQGTCMPVAGDNFDNDGSGSGVEGFVDDTYADQEQ